MRSVRLPGGIGPGTVLEKRYRVLTEATPRSSALRYVRSFELGRQVLPGPGFEIVLLFDGREQRRRATSSLCLFFGSEGSVEKQLRSKRGPCRLIPAPTS